ncbi:MAG: hypothetical protein V4581_14905 [Bacteroidota bacterium]
MSTKDLPGGSSAGTIPVEEAAERTQNWRTYLSTSGQDFITRSFYVPILSLDSFIHNNPTAEAMRVYIGLTDPNDPLTSQIFFVPIVDGKEQLFQGTEAQGGVGGPGGSNVYDMSTSCPPECGSGGGGPGDTLDG